MLGWEGYSVKKWHRTPTSRMDHITAYAMILPSVALLGVFVLWPLYTAITNSLTDWNFYNSSYVGLRNYFVAFRNPVFRKSFENIVLYILFSVPIGIVLPFLFAHCVKRLQGMYGAVIKTALYIPSIIAGVISAVIFLLFWITRAASSIT